MYSQRELNSERLQFIVENCTSYLNISSSLIKQLMKDNNKEILEIYFEHYLRFFDRFFIINMLNYNKNQTIVSDFFTLINNDKYKISTKFNDDFYQYNSSYYLFNACKSGNEAAIKYY